MEPVKLPERSPSLNAYAERFVRTIKESCLERLILFGEGSVRRAAFEFTLHNHRERNHQGLDNQLICPEPNLVRQGRKVWQKCVRYAAESAAFSAAWAWIWFARFDHARTQIHLKPRSRLHAVRIVRFMFRTLRPLLPVDASAPRDERMASHDYVLLRAR